MFRCKMLQFNTIQASKYFYLTNKLSIFLINSCCFAKLVKNSFASSKLASLIGLKSSIKIIGDHTDLYSQAYFAYDSKKAGGATRSNLRFGASPIRATYYVNNADFISCSLDNYVLKYDMLKNLKKII